MTNKIQDLAVRYRDILRQAVFLVRSMDADGELSIGQVTTLNMILDGPLRVGTIARNGGIRVPSATEQIIKLEAAGLVERMADPKDARVVLVKLTETGRLKLQHANTSRTAVMATALETLSSDERRAIAEAIPAIAKLNAAIANPTPTANQAGHQPATG